jgi:ParB family chromosome partitioning protein
MPPKKKKVAAASVGLDAREVAASDPPDNVTELAGAVEADGGSVLATYRDPFGGHWLILAALPVDKIAPTPFQRELSATHAKKLEAVIPKVERFLDPLIAIRADEGFWTPNGMHRLEAMKQLGAKSITALIVPEKEIAFRILALNTEKAHNLKDKSLEVVRMAVALAEADDSKDRPEGDWEFEFEEPGYLTIGRCYEANKRFSGSAYMAVVRRCDDYLDMSISAAAEVRAARADKVLAIDEAVSKVVKDLKEAGFKSPYLKPFVVARVNPLRFKKVKRGHKGPIAEFDETMDKMLEKAEAFDIEKVKESDITASGGSGGE